MNGLRILSLAMSLMLAVSCAVPRLTNNDRGNYRYVKIDDPTKILDVNVGALPLPGAPPKPVIKPKTFFDFNDSTQITFLKVVGAKAGNVKEIIDAVKSPLSDIPKPDEIPTGRRISIPEIKVRLLFSNIKKYYNDQRLLHPNTRLEFLNTTITIKDEKAFIYSIDRLENEFEQIDMGTLERSQEVKFNTNLSGEASGNLGSEFNTSAGDNTSSTSGTDDSNNSVDDAGKTLGTSKTTSSGTTGKTNSSSSKITAARNVGAKAELAYANTESIKEALQVKFKKIKTSFSFTPNRLTVSQRGRISSDISDNVFVTTTLRFPATDYRLDTKNVHIFSDLTDKEGKLQNVDKITRKTETKQYIPCSSANDISMSVRYEGAVRATDNLKRGRNVMEFDDKVTYYTFSKDDANSKITVSKFEYCSEVYRVTARTQAGEKLVLRIGNPPSNEVMIHEENGPGEFVKWLLRVIQKGQKETLQSDKGDLYFETVTGARKQIHISKKVMSDAEITSLKSIRTLGLEVVTDTN